MRRFLGEGLAHIAPTVALPARGVPGMLFFQKLKFYLPLQRGTCMQVFGVIGRITRDPLTDSS